MSPAGRDVWKDVYARFCSHRNQPTDCENNDISRMPTETRDGPKPQFESRVDSVEEFHSRWSYLRDQLPPRNAHVFALRHVQEFHQLYLDVVALIDKEIFPNAKEASKSLSAYRINRNKLTKTQDFLEKCVESSKNPNWAPKGPGKHGLGLLTIPQKKDILRHVTAMALSNKSLFPFEIKHCMFKMHLVNIGIVPSSDATDVPYDLFTDFAPNMDKVYQDWRKWAREEYPDKIKLLNKKTKVKTGEEAAGLTPTTINDHFDKLGEMALRLNLLHPVST